MPNTSGSGAMFFETSPGRATLSDINKQLIQCYQCIASDWQKVEKYIFSWPFTKDSYYQIRSQEFDCIYKASARFIYLNRTCYGGLYRENLQGKFNVPFGGDRTPDILKKDHLLLKASKLLHSKVNITSDDFESVINSSKNGDLVYCDPVYVNGTFKQFVRYGSKVFSWNDQERLSQAIFKAMERGVTILVSNGAYQEISDLYKFAYRICLKKTKSIGNTAKHHKVHEEFLFICDPFSRKKMWSNLGHIENKRILK